MNLKTFELPAVDSVDMAFPVLDTIPELLNEAESRGYLYGNTPYNRLFSNLFFKGGKVKFKASVDESYKAKVWVYVRAFMQSWIPKHEHKEAICAMLLSEIVEPDTDK